jgi:alpha-glucosidase
MTWPGSPTIYYGDEAGLVGWTDPDCRRTYPWDHEDTDLISLHRTLAELRKAHPVFRSGSVRPLYSDTGIIAYARFDAEECAVVCINNTEKVCSLKLFVRDAFVKDDVSFRTVLCTDAAGFSLPDADTGSVSAGILPVRLPPQSSVILIKEK